MFLQKKVDYICLLRKISFFSNVVLDAEEQEIEDALTAGKYKKAKNASVKIAQAKEAAVHYLRKDKQINIRLSSRDLLRLKQVAADEGLKYQTFISSLLHRFVSGHTLHR